MAMLVKRLSAVCAVGIAGVMVASCSTSNESANTEGSPSQVQSEFASPVSETSETPVEESPQELTLEDLNTAHAVKDPSEMPATPKSL